VVRVRFTQNHFTGWEIAEFVRVDIELTGGISANLFNVTVIPSELSPVSAQGNSVMCALLCVD